MKNKIEGFLREKKIEEIRKLLENKNSNDISELAIEIGRENFVSVFRILSKEKAADVFAHMNTEKQEELIYSITDEELKKIVENLFTDDVVDLIEEMPASVVKRIFKNMDSKDREIVNEFLNYPKDSTGTIMTNEFVDLKADMLVKEAFEYIKKMGIDKETIYNLYVLDENRKLIGILSIRELLFADENSLIKDIMKIGIVYGETLESKFKVAKRLQKYDFLALPIVDTEKRLVGIVTIDDAIKTLQQETTQSFEKLGAIRPTGEEYFKTSVFMHSRNRIIWLTILMFAAIIVEMIISRYARLIETLPILISFLPLLMDTGGNSGAQASTLVVRGLATEEIKATDFFKVLFKEIQIALLIGITLATINGIRIYFQYANLKLAFVVGITLILTILIAKSIGAFLPIIAKKLKMDPAIMAAPLITTIIDVVSVMIYFHMAIWIMHI